MKRPLWRKKESRKRKGTEEEVGLEEAPEQDEIFSPPEETLTEVPGSQELNMPSSSAPFSPASTSASSTSTILPLPPAKTFNNRCESKRNGFFRRSMRTINTGSNFIRNEKRKLSLFISEATHNTLLTLSDWLANIRSITLKKRIFPSQDEESDNKSFVGKTDDFDDADFELSSSFKEAIHFIVMSITFRVFSIVVFFVHTAVLIAALSLTPKGMKLPLTYHITFLIFGLFFFVDVLFQVFLEGVTSYFSSIINALDLFAIVLFLILDVTYICFDIGGIQQIPKLTFFVKALRLFVLLKVFQLISSKRKIEKAVRKLVSENKRRYRKDGFDLDLTYITDNVIAMSFPSSGGQSLYRNHIKEVVRFLDTKHPDHYKIYNLCSERTYNYSYFHNRVETFPIDDHNVPSLIDMLKFVDSVFEWMEKDPQNIIVVHCKGGKGRTGTMICIWLIASEHFDTAKESLEHFGKRRTDTASSAKYQGVETPSQSRYVEYFAQIKNKYHWAIPQSKILRIKSITIYSIRGVGKGNGKDLKIVLMMNKKVIYVCLCSSAKCCQVSHNDDTNSVTITLNNCPKIHDDVKVKFFSSSGHLKIYEKCAFFFWFNTAFVEKNRLYLSRNELDNPHKQKTWNVYREDFAVEFLFETI
ncbi:LOW QUALITY PROTEIN: phosphatidylinositol 3,4,5-trisphosphate 3-phosphatase TPTE2-like [Petaurus breviceps papuanus]|uniref:LOW QUALITY PROTEIN: phosphatidylinositol 3,4,5-trisphosphate 3-phosphatase TPTE2-like n=1 Tax=Petaurus breviceps papuanus TaxID=3040969 RepID=UPI0036D9D1B9